MSNRTVVHLDLEADSIEELMFQLSELKPHIKAVGIVIVLDGSDEDDVNRLMWYAKPEDSVSIIGLLEALKFRVIEDAGYESL